MTGKNGEWKIRQSEFKGFVKAKLESLEKGMEDMNKKLGEMQKERVSFIKEVYLKLGSLSAIVAIILTIIINFIM